MIACIPIIQIALETIVMMKFPSIFFTYLTVFSWLAIAAPLEVYIFFYPPGTPEATKVEAKNLIANNGGRVIYDYSVYIHILPNLGLFDEILMRIAITF